MSAVYDIHWSENKSTMNGREVTIFQFAGPWDPETLESFHLYFKVQEKALLIKHGSLIPFDILRATSSKSDKNMER